MRRHFKALSSAPSELLAAKWYVGDPGVRGEKKIHLLKAPLPLRCKYGDWSSSGRFYVCFWSCFLGEAGAETSRRDPALFLPPQDAETPWEQHFWGGAHLVPTGLGAL